MNSENTLQFDTRRHRPASLSTNMLNNVMISHKINPNKIAKQTYETSVFSQKASTNIRRNSVAKRSKGKNSTQILKNVSMSDLDSQNLRVSPETDEILDKLQECDSDREQYGKENFSVENLDLAQINKDGPNVQYHPKSATLKTSKKLTRNLSSSQEVMSQSSDSQKLNRFSNYAHSDSKQISSQDYAECQSFSLEDSFRGGLNTPRMSQSKVKRHSSHENDYSDRETIDCLSEPNHGSQTRLAKGSLRVENPFEKYSESKGPFWNSQENSCCTTLDCDEALGGSNSALLNDKKEDSIPDDLEFEQEFGLFSSNNTTPTNKQLIDESTALIKGKQEKEISIEEELANFNPEINPCAFDSDTINYLIVRENDYAPDPHYMDKKQNEINWSMRAILLDWMMEVSMEFGLKRETYHYAINYIDRYLTAVINVQKWELQLVGVTALYMAAKVEEIYPPGVSSFAKSTDGAYSAEQITNMELKMLKALKWLLTPPSLNTWANWYMNQWDLYVERSEYAKNHPLILSHGEELIQFKQSNQKSYARFREMMQLMDCAVLDAQTLQYKPRALIASLMYVLLGKYFKQFTTQQIFDEFPRNSSYLVDKNSSFNGLFGDFLTYSFGFELTDLLPSIQYVSTYIKLPLVLDLPKAVKMSKENVLEGHFEEFLAYQTHHSYNIQYIKRRPRSNF